MALILNIETSTTVCSVSLGKDGKVISLKEQDGDYSHAENLTLFIVDVLAEAKCNLSHVDAIAVSKGPGSYTGLRIGVSTAKGLCYALNKPLIAIETLQALCVNVAEQHNNLKTLFCPMIDARRMEVYCGIYNNELENLLPVSAEIIDSDFINTTFSKLKKTKNEYEFYFFGNGALKCNETFLNEPNVYFIDNIITSASNMAILSEKAFKQSKFEDIAYFEPFYLKDFVAGKSKKIVTE